MNAKDTLEVAPAKIAEGQWVVRSAHLIGSDQVCPDELSAKRMAKFAEACIKAARAKDRELIQMAVDYMHKYVEGWVEEHWKEVMCKEENAFLEKAAAQGFKPSEQ